ncbi:copper amine oxidase N-terminal domain-containing protein [Intestinibacillus massiliensis]|nr:copper amine oxidase N-terminal domain-containing protein [Intestinibacillus massiliensis]
MKSYLKRAIAAALAALLAVCAAPSVLAADKPVSVVLDGRAVAFAEGGEPVLKDGRTYVPFRAIFEAMGAQVGWDEATETVSAERDGVSVRFVLGNPAVSVTEGGRTRTLQTDAAPFLSNGNTLVPVRFAAQAFGANVGWDAGTQTVLVVDVDKLKEGYADKFIVMDRYLTFAVPEGTQSVDGSLALGLTLKGAAGEIQVPVQAAFHGLWGADGGSLNVRFQADTAALSAALETDGDAVDGGLANLLLSMRDVSFDCILDLSADAFYLRSAALTSENIPAGAWVRLSLDRALGLLSNGRLNAAMLRGMANHDFVAYVAGLAQNVGLSSQAEDGVAAVRKVFDGQAQLYGDGVFLPLGDALQAASGTEDGTSAKLLLQVSGEKVLSATSETRQVEDGQAVYECSVEQGADGHTAVTAAIHAAAYEATLSGEIIHAPSGEGLVLTPEGKIVP